MADNNKISIEVEINASGHQQLTQYKNAFDGLRTSINNLSTPISKLDGDVVKLKDALGKTGTQGNIISETINRFEKASKDAGITTEFFKKAIVFLEGGVISLKGALSGGLTVLLAFAPEITKWYNEVMTSGKAASEAELSISSMNEALGGTEYSAAVKQIGELTVNTDLAKQGFMDKEEVLEQYNSTVGQTMGQVSTLQELEDKLIKGGPAYIKMTMLKASAQMALQNSAKKAFEAEQLKLKGDAESANFTDKLKAGFMNFFSSTEFDGSSEYDADVKKAGAKRKQKLVETAEKEKNSFLKVAESLQKQALDIAKTNNFNYTPLRPAPTGQPEKPTAKVKITSTSNKKQKSREVVDGEPREGVTLLEAKKPGLNINIDTNRTEEQKQQDLIALQALDPRNDPAVKKTQATQEEIDKIEEFYAKKKADREDALANAKIHAGDRFIDAALKNSKKDSAIYKAAFLAKKATSIADTIISTKRAVMESFKAYAGIPFVGQALGIIQAVFMAGQGAMSIAEIAKQKPGFSRGGQFRSDGRGAFLPGYSRMDDTNAYLRSGEAVVVSEAMRNPWARNLVSAINVAYGGRDFSVTNPGRGYAIGGIFTDGGNSNRYYNQPMNDQKDLANTIAYQMINNFPPVYVDVKDINTQQNIMAQTINRVNL